MHKVKVKASEIAVLSQRPCSTDHSFLFADLCNDVMQQWSKFCNRMCILKKIIPRATALIFSKNEIIS
ncbi:hypothetical protein T4C_2322 [Trichinella pseudospiralis]|uniref:Uncharacterized protein n=1 Tax=Trichinella pseudospiralis TaxID=6337 RepID=A0A0V1J7U8_TRIPS|nr:hypothetical protein T4C_2322 [Trichinella pseudospiralis]